MEECRDLLESQDYAPIIQSVSLIFRCQDRGARAGGRGLYIPTPEATPSPLPVPTITGRAPPYRPLCASAHQLRRPILGNLS